MHVQLGCNAFYLVRDGSERGPRVVLLVNSVFCTTDDDSLLPFVFQFWLGNNKRIAKQVRSEFSSVLVNSSS